MMLFFTLFGWSCATLGNYIVPPLHQRWLRISRKEPKTEFRWNDKRRCGLFNMSTCRDVEMIENDFDFTKQVDRDKFNDMGFICRVEEEIR